MPNQTVCMETPAFNGVLQSLRRDPRVDPHTVLPKLGATKHKPVYITSSHMSAYLKRTSLDERHRMATTALKGWLSEFDAIAFRGMSGALIAPVVASRLKKSLIMVRKPNDDSHSTHKVEGDSAARRYIILDDFCCNGDTQRAIREAITTFAPKAVCLGVLEVDNINPGRLDQYADGKYRLVYTDDDGEYF